METKEIFALSITLINLILTFRVNYFVKRQDDRAKNYSELDKVYDALLKDANNNPKFRDPGFTQEYLSYKDSGDEKDTKLKYEIYAFRCMNFCETIFDIKDIELRKTWDCIIISESKLHSKWFERPDNQERFKDLFTKFVSTGCKKVP